MLLEGGRRTQINLYRVDEGVVGLYSQYSVLEELRKALPLIEAVPQERLGRNGSRGVFQLDLPTPDGTLPLAVKPKFKAGSFERYSQSYRLVQESRRRLRTAGGTLAQAYRDQIILFRKSIRNTSVLRETGMAGLAAERYEAVYGESLPIEQAVGFFVNREGRKWSFFEKIPEEIDSTALSEKERGHIQKQASEFAKLMGERLEEVGIDPVDLWRQGAKNVLACGDPDSPRFVLIDTEDWEKIPGFK